MIFESRKWRLFGRALALLVSTVLILSYSDLASYALQSSEPEVISSAQDLEESVGGRFITVSGAVDIDHSIALHRDQVTTYWLPMMGLGAPLFVVTENRDYERRSAAGEPLSVLGKITGFSSAPNSSEAREVYEEKTGLEIPEDAYVLLEGEEPREFGLMVPLIGLLGLIWFLSLVGFIRELRRSGRAGA